MILKKESQKEKNKSTTTINEFNSNQYIINKLEKKF